MTAALTEAKFQSELPAYPTIGIVGTIIGTFVAMELVPADPTPTGALLQSSLALTAGLGLAPALAIIKRPKAFFRAENLLAICPIYWLLLDLVQGIYPLPGIERAVVVKTFLAIGLYGASVWLGSMGRPWKPPGALRRSAELYLEPKLIFRIAVIFFILGFCRYAIPAKFNPVILVTHLGNPRFATAWASSHVSGGLTGAIINHLVYFGYLLPSFAVLLGLRAGWRDRRTWIVGVFALIISLYIAQGGGRRIIGIIYGTAILLWILEQPRIDLRRLFVLVVFTFVMLWVLEFILEYRHGGFQKAFEEQPKEDVSILAYDFVEDPLRRGDTDPLIRVDDNFLRMCQIITIFPDLTGGRFLGERPIIYALARPIPRALWPGKPLNPGFDLGFWFGQGASLSTSIIGDWYLSAGMIGVFLGGIFYGRLASLATGMLKTLKPGSTGTMVYSFFTLSFVVGYRQLIELVLTSYIVLIWVGLSSLYLSRRSSKLPQSTEPPSPYV